MTYPLLIRSILDRARTYFPANEITTRTASGIFRYTYGDMARRAALLASGLSRLGVQRGDRVATFGWNTYRHLELYFGVPCSGAVLHTVNIRLFPEQLAYILNHAEDKVVFVDPDLVPIIESFADKLSTVRHYVVMCDREAMPNTSLLPVMSYEELLLLGTPDYQFPEALDEDTPAVLCYTSATTGNPKGVMFSHRNIYLHTAHECMTDVFGLSERDTILPVVPMFHANFWGLAWSAGFIGAKLVLPGERPDAQSIAALIQSEHVTLAAAVPTVWIGVLELLEQAPVDLSSLERLIVGGAAVPRFLMEAYDKLGITILHAYGMTEGGPLTHVSRVSRGVRAQSEEERYRVRLKQGYPVAGIEQRAIDEDGNDVPWDGKTMGEVLLRGPWVAAEYYRDERTADGFKDGWYHTGDVAMVDENGYLELVDRTKDVVKSGGEWISSVDLENELMGHPAVREAAVVGVTHPRWQERPIACVVLKADQAGSVTEEDLLQYLAPKLAKWWLPDRVLFIDEIPKTGVGKFDKKVLRTRYLDILATNQRN